MCKNASCKHAGTVSARIAIKTTIGITEMTARVSAASADIESIATLIGENIATGPATAQSKRLVAIAMIKQAQPMLQQVSSSVAYIMRAEPDTDEAAKVAADTDTGALIQELVKLADGIAEAIASQFGVEESAIAPFLVETNSIMLPVVEDLIARAKAAMAEAEALSV